MIATRLWLADDLIILPAEQLPVNRLSHRAIALVVRMHMVAAVVVGSQTCWLCRIAQHGVKIDHRIVRATRANPVIDRLPLLLHEWRPEARIREAFDREQRRAIYPEAHRTRPSDDLLVALDNLLHGDVLRRDPD